LKGMGEREGERWAVYTMPTEETGLERFWRAMVRGMPPPGSGDEY